MEPPPPPSPVVSIATTNLNTDLQIAPYFHKHPLIPFTRFDFGRCEVCFCYDDYAEVNIYGGYRCNELGCGNVVFHKDCVKRPLQEINHSSHPHHPLKLIIQDSHSSHPHHPFKLIIQEKPTCSLCKKQFKVGYSCSICDFKLDLSCVRRPEPFLLPANSYGHEHPLFLDFKKKWEMCSICQVRVLPYASRYSCHECGFVIHVACMYLLLETYHSSHPQHPLKLLKCEIPIYADDKRCLLCAEDFDGRSHQLHHCDICNFSICRACIKAPPPVHVECLTTHDHPLRLFPRLIDFTCTACGTKGDRSPYFCVECNFMIHRQCIGLPRVININLHDHRISYVRRLGHGEWKCRVCRKKVDGFYGAYTCVKCPSLVVHSLCATNKDVWDLVEREGTPEEEEIPPFEEIDDTTIKHFSHDHNLRINKDGLILPENMLCVACVFQICSEPFYSCEQCNFILHEKCAHLPRMRRHVLKNLPFTLYPNALNKIDHCGLCFQAFTGFRYKVGSNIILDVRCSSTSDSVEHGSHQHPLYYTCDYINQKCCNQCGDETSHFFGCAECDYFLDGKCALLPKKVTKIRYDDHPLILWFGDKKVEGEYWCEACETKVDPTKWFYTCNDCGTVLHISCIVGDLSYISPGSEMGDEIEVVSNNSVCRLLCFGCNSRCKLPQVIKSRRIGDCVYACSFQCYNNL